MSEEENQPDKKLTLKGLQADTTKQMDQVDDRLTNLESSVTSGFDDIRDMIRNMAKNNPASIRSDGLDSRDVYANEDTQPILTEANANGDLEHIVRPKQAIGSPEFAEKEKQMEFDLMLICIRVAHSSNQFPDNTFTVGVNGIPWLVVRGVDQWLPRNVVEVLARSKTSVYDNIERVSDRNERYIDNPETMAQRYPFNVVRDPAGAIGQQWYERVMNESLAQPNRLRVAAGRAA